MNIRRLEHHLSLETNAERSCASTCCLRHADSDGAPGRRAGAAGARAAWGMAGPIGGSGRACRTSGAAETADTSCSGRARAGGRPRNGAPCRWVTRKTDDSAIPKRRAISAVGVEVSAYSRVTSRSCSSLSFRLGGTPRRASSAPTRLMLADAAASSASALAPIVWPTSGDPERCVSGASITAPLVRGEDPEPVGRLTVHPECSPLLLVI